MPKLESLTLSHNNLNGTLDGMCNPSNRVLRSLDLQHNTLEGSIPSDIAQCSNLIDLKLSDNLFYGPIPSILPSTLQYIHIDRNDLSGNLPNDTIRNMENLRKFQADRNELRGQISSDIFENKLNLTYLNLQHNEFSGSVPVLSYLENLVEVFLGSNAFDHVYSNSFAYSRSLKIVDLTYQNVKSQTNIKLEEAAFANLSPQVNLVRVCVCVCVESTKTNSFPKTKTNVGTDREFDP